MTHKEVHSLKYGLCHGIDPHIKAIAYMYARGVPQMMIADLLQIHRNTVYKYIQRYQMDLDRERFIETTITEGLEIIEEGQV